MSMFLYKIPLRAGQDVKETEPFHNVATASRPADTRQHNKPIKLIGVPISLINLLLFFYLLKSVPSPFSPPEINMVITYKENL